MQPQIDSNNFKIKFDGQAHQVDAQVLISSLIHTTTIIQELNKHLDSGKKIEIKVKALEKGSFLIHLELLETTLESLKNIFTKENIIVASSIITGLVALIELKKHLKGKSPKEIKRKDSTTIIINGDNNQLSIDSNIYQIYESDTVINDALSQNFDTIDQDPAIAAFEITDEKEKPYVRVERSDFKDLSQKIEIIDENKKTIIENTRLNIVRLSFEEGLKWDFYYRGNKISAKITDPNFQKLIDNGESFAKGDILEVELQINQIFDSSVNTYINKSYQVNRIIQHYNRDEQQKIKFE
ncbi:hypothetical protein [Fluviicola sp.]|jgi:hypothetical protein|uniref:hypothetical protein n=1 Tax=Fluviicola sp. TaxID=1917219 RepID=UPI002820A81F|nr:hypothetical protein [Fluviicola sp.]MDR0801593.1 hypothetical protein [Fluviicola sp.]